MNRLPTFCHATAVRSDINLPKAKERNAAISSAQNVNETTHINPLTPELNPSAERCLTRFFTGDFAS
jgi:hypothetical protein